MAGLRAARAAWKAVSHVRLRSVFSSPASRDGVYAPMTWIGPAGADRVTEAARVGR